VGGGGGGGCCCFTFSSTVPLEKGAHICKIVDDALYAENDYCSICVLVIRVPLCDD